MSKPHDLDEIVTDLAYHYLGSEYAPDHLKVVLREVRFTKTISFYGWEKARSKKFFIPRYITRNSIYWDYA